MPATNGPDWRNRIVETGVKAARDIVPNDQNWRSHPNAQLDALGGVIGDIGLILHVTINARDLPEWGARRGVATLVDGHARLALALQQGADTELPFSLVNLSPREEALALATLDPLGAMAGADAERLAALLDGVSTGDAAVQVMLGDLARETGAVVPDFAPSGEPMARLDQKTPVTCPACGHEFTT